jgi:hypothetical protein
METIRQGPQADGITVSIANLCAGSGHRPPRCTTSR